MWWFRVEYKEVPFRVLLFFVFGRGMPKCNIGPRPIKEGASFLFEKGANSLMQRLVRLKNNDEFHKGNVV